MRAAVLQITSSDKPEQNLKLVREMIYEAKANGADIVCTPEVTNCLSTSRKHQVATLRREENDCVLAGLREMAKACGVWICWITCFATDDEDGRFANRSFAISHKEKWLRDTTKFICSMSM